MADRDDRPTRAPGPRGLALVSCLLGIRRDRLGLVERMAAEYGDVVEVRAAGRRLYLVSHPEVARHVLSVNAENYHKGFGLDDARPLLGSGLLTSEGALWARQRETLRAAFSGRHVEEHARVVLARVGLLVERWEGLAASGAVVDVDGEMVRLTLDVLGEAFLGRSIPRDPARLSDDLRRVDRWAMRRMASPLRLPLAAPAPGHRRVRRSLRALRGLAEEMLAGAPGVDRGDGATLLGLLAPRGSAAESRQARDEFLTFLLAGHETTAAALCWTWSLLAAHPEAEARLHREVDALPGGQSPRPSDLPRLSYTRAVVQEAMRLYPPVWMIARRAVAADRLGAYLVAPGSDVLVCVYTVHRHAAFWPDPSRFDPSRFEPGGAGHRHPCAYLAFGAGPRACIGARLGLLEATLAVAAIARRFRLTPGLAQPVVPEASLTLRPRHGLWMRVGERHPTPGAGRALRDPRGEAICRSYGSL